MVTSTPSPQLSRAGRAKQVLQMHKLIKSKLSKANENEQSCKIETLQTEFYGHLKMWLVPRVKSILEADLNAVQTLIDDFELAITELETSDEEEDIRCYTDICESMIEECKEALPLRK